MPRLNRRHFLQTTSAASAAWMTQAPQVLSANARGANDRVRIAVAGLNGRGGSHINGWLGQDNVEIAYLVDPDRRVRTRRAKSVTERVDGKYTPEVIADIREALDDKNLDAISIAAPNHWHSLMTIWGAQAGKHVYVEKPMSHDVLEGRVAVEAQEKYGVVVQHGTQRRSDARIAGLHEAIQDGRFGRLKISYGYCCKPRGGIGLAKTSAPPDYLNWNLWQGPAVIDQYHDNYVHYDWHWFWETGNGDLNNQGTHQLDVARWALDRDQTHPLRVSAIGGRFQWDDQGETPNTMFAMAEYPNGQYVFFNVRNVNYDGYERQVENEYYFEDGGKIIRGKYYPSGSSKGEPLDLPPGDVTPGGNWGSFIAAIRAGDPSMANGTAQQAHYACVLGHLMNNSYRIGEKVPFSADAGDFGGNQDAREHFEKLHTIMTDGVGIPTDGTHYTAGPMLEFDPQTERHRGEHAQEANALLMDPQRNGFEIPTVNRV